MNFFLLIKSQLNLKRIVQIYLGVFLLSNVGIGWLIPLSDLKLPPDSEFFISQLWKINLIMPMVKLIEFVAAVLFLINRKNILALLLFYPVLFNIVCIGIHFFGSIQYTALMILGVLYLSWVYRHDLKKII